MHSLEPEYRELLAAGGIEPAAARRAIAQEKRLLLGLFNELRLAMYLSVAAIMAGIGIVLKSNLDRLGPISVILGLAAAAVVCYASAVRTRLRGGERSTGGDYVLLLGALIVSADLGFAETQFHLFGEHWSRHLLILAAVHAATAYALDARLVLSVALVALIGWFGWSGAEIHVVGLWSIAGAPTEYGMRALSAGSLIFLWREAHRRFGGVADFLPVFEHFAANLGFGGAVVWCAGTEMRWVGVPLLAALAAASIRQGLRHGEEAFVVYGVLYGAFGMATVSAQVLHDPLARAVMVLGISIAAAVSLWRLHAKLKEAEP